MNGQIELICGPMFSGKTTTLIKRLVAARRGGLEIAVFKPAADTRYSMAQIVSHDGESLPAVRVEVDGAPEIVAAASAAHVIGLDEVHFFPTSLVEACAALAREGARVVAAGVEFDHRGQPFEVVQELARVANIVTRVTAICARCGAAARHSQRLVNNDARIFVGGPGDYEPRCDECFEPG